MKPYPFCFCLAVFLGANPVGASSLPPSAVCSDSLLGLADNLKVSRHARLDGEVRTTTQAPPCALPVLPALPQPGSGQKVVPWLAKSSLDTSFHGAVLVRWGGQLLLKPGRYRLAKLVMEWGSVLRVDTSGTGSDITHPGIRLDVQGAVHLYDGVSTCYPGLADSLEASRIALIVEGPQAVTMGYGAQVHLQLIAPQSSLELRDWSRFVGRFLVRQASVGRVEARYAANGVELQTPSGVVAIQGRRRFWTRATSVPVEWSLDGLIQTSQTTEALPQEGPWWIRRCAAGSCDSVLALVDRTPPAVVILAPPNGWLTNQPRLAVRWSADGYLYTDSSQLTEGGNTLLRSATDSAGNVGRASVVVRLDTKAPVVAIQSPLPSAWVNRTPIEVRWSADGLSRVDSVALAEGTNSVTRNFVDSAGNTGSASVVVKLDTKAPVVVISSPINGDTVPSAQVLLLWSADGVAHADTVSLQVGTNTITRSAQDSAGNVGSATVQVFRQNAAPPLVAPPLPSVGIPTLGDRLSFLYTGPSPVQIGAVVDTFNAERLSQLFGTVRRPDHSGLAGARVEILDHPEYGYTLTRADGRWDLVVNGGGSLVVLITKSGYLPVQRRVELLWRQISHIDDVFLTALSSSSLVANVAGTSVVAQAVIGERMTDISGSRQVVLNLPSGLSARLVGKNGDTTSVTSLTLRATEYTVGPYGPKSMPGLLPPASAYTYAVELSADEALASGAQTILFNKPASVFLENFLDFRVGGIVPAGWYDRAKGFWVPSDNGRVIQVLSVASGTVTVDVNGDGLADEGDSTPSAQDRALLASRYQAGQTLWWVQINHLTPWDFNWSLPDIWKGMIKKPEKPDGPKPDACPSTKSGCVLSIENRSLEEDIPVAGTGGTLHWNSLNAKEQILSRTVRLHLMEDTLPPWLDRISVSIDVAGQHYEKGYIPQLNLDVDWSWDGKDGWGRNVVGTNEAVVKICYVFRGTYHEPVRFGSPGGTVGRVTLAAGGRGSNKVATNPIMTQAATPLSSDGREEIDVCEESKVALTNDMAADWGLGGWTSPQFHRLDVLKMEVHLGGGGISKAVDLSDQLEFVPVRIAFAWGKLAFEPNGSLWLSNYWSAEPTGSLQKIPGGPPNTKLWSGPPIYSPLGMALEQDGSLLVTGRNPRNTVWEAYRYSQLVRVQFRDSTAVVTSLLDTVLGFYGDGGPAAKSRVNDLQDVVVAGDGSIYLADNGNARVRRIGPDGIINTVAGTGVKGYSGDGGPATSAQISGWSGLAMRRNGALLIGDHYSNRIREIGVDGVIRTLAGTGASGSSGDGASATLATLDGPFGVAESPDGGFCFAEAAHVRCVDADGIIHTIAGGNFGPGAFPQIPTWGAIQPYAVAFDPQGSLYFNDMQNAAGQLLRIRNPLSPLRYSLQPTVPSQDGSELWIFDSRGNHLLTLDARNGDTLWAFEYGPDSLLSAMRNRQGERTQIQRFGKTVTLIAPPSQGSLRTVLALDDSGRVVRATGPDGRAWSLGWKGDLLASFTKPDAGTNTFTYDSLGQLVRDTDPRGAWQELSGGLWKGVTKVKHTTSSGLISQYETTKKSSGTFRTRTAPDSGVTKTNKYADGTVRQYDPDGTITVTTIQPDPRWGLAAPQLASRVVISPAGLRDSSSWAATVSDTSLFGFDSLTQTWNHNGQIWTTVTMPRLNLVKATSPTGVTSTGVLDSRHRLVQLNSPGLLPVSFGYDTLDRITAITQGGRTTRFGWDDSGRVSTVIDPLGQVRSFRYDIAGRVLAQILADGRKVQLGYDAGDRVVSLTPPGRAAHGFAYDRAGLDTLWWAPKLGADSTPTALRYDSDQRPVWVRLPNGDTLRTVYNAAGQMISMRSFRDMLQFGYDSTGRLGAMSRGSQALSFAYDGFMVRSQAWSGTLSGSLATTWNANLQPATQAANGSSVAYAYDADGMLAKVGSLSVSRDAVSGLFRGDTVGSVVHRLGLDGYGQVLADTVRSGSTVLARMSLQRDSLGRILSRSDSLNGTKTAWRYHYDLSGRLDSVWLNGTLSAWYGYDSNSVRVRGTGITGVVVDAQDRVTSANGVSYGYDANGQMVSRTSSAGTTRYHSTKLGELQSVVVPSGDSISYTLDPLGRRIARSLNGVVTNRWLWDGSLRLVAEVDASGAVLSRYVYAVHTNVPDYLVRAGVTYRLVKDHLGSVRMVVNASTGAVVSSLNYDVWGQVTSSVNPGFQPFGFAGGLREDATGLTHFGAREYLPELGRWIQKDPIGFNGGLSNLYGYVGNDPVNGSDAAGLSSMNKFFCPTSRISKAADEVKAPKGWIYVKGHGIVQQGEHFGWLKDERGDAIDPDALAREIYDQPDFFTNTKVMLLICNAAGGEYAKLVYQALRNGTWKGSLQGPDSMVFFDSTNHVPTPYGPKPQSVPSTPDSNAPGKYKVYK